jgi:hypothetical protein
MPVSRAQDQAAYRQRQREGLEVKRVDVSPNVYAALDAMEADVKVKGKKWMQRKALTELLEFGAAWYLERKKVLPCNAD